MSDPLSIAASVGGLALLAKEMVQKMGSLIDSVRGAKAEMQNLMNEVASLYGILKGLRLILEQMQSKEVTVMAPGKVVYACNATLEEIRKVVEMCGSGSDTAGSSNKPTSKPHSWDSARKKITWAFKKEHVEKLLVDLEKHKATLLLTMTQNSMSSVVEVLRKQDETVSQLDEVKMAQSQMCATQLTENERHLNWQRRELLRSVSDLRPEISLQKHLALRQKGTGLWFIEGSTFEHFLDTPNSRLWLYGIPGAGKSVLSAAIIESANRRRNEGVATAFFFCEYDNKATQTAGQILGSIARQLAIQSPSAFAVLEDFYNECDGFHQASKTPKDSDWVELVQDMSTRFDTTIIVVDGLDECSDGRSAVVQALAELSSRGSIKTLFTSREEMDIKDGLAAFDSLAIAADKADVRLYVATDLDFRFHKMTSKDPSLRQEILENLVDRSDGMFQWVKCQLDYLFSLPTNRLRRKELNNLPPDLPQTYARILRRAVDAEGEWTLRFIERTLRWVALAKPALSLDAIAEAIVVDQNETELDDSLEIEAVLRPCRSLIQIVDDTVVFSHFSVKEYLSQIDARDAFLGRFRIDEKKDQAYLATTCLSYLLLEDFSNLDLQDKAESWTTCTDRYQFYSYATQSWMLHAQLCGHNHVQDLEFRLFSLEKPDQFVIWAYNFLLLCFEGQSLKNLHMKMFDVTPLHLACIFRLPIIVDRLLTEGADVNRFSKLLRTPLLCAIKGRRHGRTAAASQEDAVLIVKRLLREDILRQEENSPVASAMRTYQPDLMLLLVDNGFQVTREVLRNARFFLSHEHLQQLLERTKGASLDAESQSLLIQLLSEWDGPKIRQLKHLDTLEPTSWRMREGYKRMIQTAARHGRIHTLLHLLPSIKLIDGDEKQALLSQCIVNAAEHGQIEVIDLLLQDGIDATYRKSPNEPNILHRVVKALKRSDSSRHFHILRRLMESCLGFSHAVEAKDSEGLTPWMYAIRDGKVNILNFFLTAKPDIDLHQRTDSGLTPAHLAASSRDEGVIYRLQELAVDFTIRNSNGEAPFEMFLGPSSTKSVGDELFERMLQVLIRNENDLSASSCSGRNLLHMLMDYSYKEFGTNHTAGFLREVLESRQFAASRETALMSTDSMMRTPLHACLQNQLVIFKERGMFSSTFLEVLSLLCNPPGVFRKHLSVTDRQGRSPIMAFAANLLHHATESSEWSSDMRLQGSGGRMAIVSGVFRVLIEADGFQGESFSKQKDCLGKTALHYIATSRAPFPFHEVASLFVNYGADPSIEDNDGKTAVMVAVESTEGTVDFLRHVLRVSDYSTLERVNSDGFSLVHYITMKHGVESLFEHHLALFARCRIKDRNGEIPLMRILRAIPDVTTAKRLVELAQENVYTCDDYGRNCIYWACRFGIDQVLAALADNCATINEAISSTDASGTVMEDPPLLVAAKFGHVDTVRVLLERGADVSVRGHNGWQLHHVVMSLPPPNSFMKLLDDVEELDLKSTVSRFYLNQGVSFQGGTALHIAASNLDTRKPLEWLLECERVRDVNPRTDCGATPLHMACWRGNLDACRALVCAGASVLEAGADGLTPFHAACESGSLEVCKFLISKDASLASLTGTAEPPLDIAARHNYSDIARFLLEHNCHISPQAESKALNVGNVKLADMMVAKLQETGRSHRHEDSSARRWELICREGAAETGLLKLIPTVANPNARVTEEQETALHVASRLGWIRAVQALVNRTVDLDVQDCSGLSPLATATRYGHFGCAKMLHQSGADPMIKDGQGHTVLHWVAFRHDADALSYFLEAGLDVNEARVDGRTPLHSTWDPACLELMLQNGADPFRVSSFWGTPVAEASTWDKDGACIQLMLANQPQAKIREAINGRIPRYGKTPLYHAAFRGNIDVVETLVGLGADVNLLGGPLGTPFQAALKQRFFHISTLLLRKGAKPCLVVDRGIERAAWHWELGARTVLPLPDGTWMTDLPS